MSLLVAISLVAGMGHAASAAAPASLIDHQHAPEMSMSPMMEAGHMMHGPAQQPASPHHHHDLTGCACCAMACCAAVLPPMALVSRAVQRISVVYASFLASERGIGAVLEPDPPRPLTL